MSTRRRILRKIREAQNHFASDKEALRKLGSLYKKATLSNRVFTLEDVEQEVDRIYGEQSKNDIYYFTRRRVMKASNRRGRLGQRRKRAYAHPNLRWRGNKYRNQEEKLVDILFTYVTAHGANSNEEAYNFLDGNPRLIVNDIISAWGMAPEDSGDLLARWEHYKKLVRRKLMVRMAAIRYRKAHSSLPGPVGDFEGVYDPNYNDEFQAVDPFFKNRNFTEYKDVRAMIPPGGEPGYMTQNDNVMNWHHRNVDIDMTPRPEVLTDQYWMDQPDEFPHIREDNPRVGSARRRKASRRRKRFW